VSLSRNPVGDLEGQRAVANAHETRAWETGLPSLVVDDVEVAAWTIDVPEQDVRAGKAPLVVVLDERFEKEIRENE